MPPPPQVAARCGRTTLHPPRAATACDVVLVARDGVEIPAHKVVLAAYSDYFALRAETNEWCNSCALQWIKLGGASLILSYVYLL